jgi:cytoskeletal protein CcmA (bactofilin family)
VTADGRSPARPSTAGPATVAAPATDETSESDTRSTGTPTTAEEISARLAGLADDPRAFKHRISADASISGRIHFPGNARVDGRLKGEIRADAILVVGERALLEADVRAHRLLLRGTVHGSVSCPGFAELAPGSVVVGAVAATTLLVRPGARIEGTCRVGSPVGSPASAPGAVAAAPGASPRVIGASPASRLAGR